MIWINYICENEGMKKKPYPSRHTLLLLHKTTHQSKGSLLHTAEGIYKDIAPSYRTD